jgi:hypothetical protein
MLIPKFVQLVLPPALHVLYQLPHAPLVLPINSYSLAPQLVSRPVLINTLEIQPLEIVNLALLSAKLVHLPTYVQYVRLIISCKLQDVLPNVTMVSIYLVNNVSLVIQSAKLVPPVLLQTVPAVPQLQISCREHNALETV